MQILKNSYEAVFSGIRFEFECKCKKKNKKRLEVYYLYEPNMFC